jgi:hypothetical protein
VVVVREVQVVDDESEEGDIELPEIRTGSGRTVK